MFVLASASASRSHGSVGDASKFIIMEDLLTEFIPFILGFLTIFVAYLFWRRSNSAEENSSEEDTTNESKYMHSV